VKPSEEEKLRAYIEARVLEYGNIQASTPPEFTQRAWRDLCRHFGVTGAGPRKARTLEEALVRVAELAG
jgi:hypothetical protein